MSSHYTRDYFNNLEYFIVCPKCYKDKSLQYDDLTHFDEKYQILCDHCKFDLTEQYLKNCITCPNSRYHQKVFIQYCSHTKNAYPYCLTQFRYDTLEIIPVSSNPKYSEWLKSQTEFLKKIPYSYEY